MKAYSYKMQLDEQRLPFLVRERTYYMVDRRFRYGNPERIHELAREIGLDKMAEEYIYCVCSDALLRVIGLFEVSHGTVGVSIASPREIFQKALMLGAVNVTLIHNHPSGDPTPSGQDISLTKMIKDAGQMIGISLLDHVVVGDNCYCSLREENYVAFDDEKERVNL